MIRSKAQGSSTFSSECVRAIRLITASLGSFLMPLNQHAQSVTVGEAEPKRASTHSPKLLVGVSGRRMRWDECARRDVGVVQCHGGLGEITARMRDAGKSTKAEPSLQQRSINRSSRK